MSQVNFKVLVAACMLSSGVYFTSCKSKAKETTNTVDTTAIAPPTSTAPATAPVEISKDTVLESGVRDATKDYPGVNAAVNNGEITLTGEIKRSKLPNLMMTLNSLRPKKINNQLTVK